MENLGKFVLFLATIFVTTFCSGITLSIMWDWFIVPVFELPVLGVYNAMGVSLLIRYLTYTYVPPVEESFVELQLGLVIRSVFLSCFVLVVGYTLKVIVYGV